MHNHYHSLDKDDQDLLGFISTASACIGVAGSCFIIFTYMIFKSSRSFGTKMVFCLSLADLLHGISWFPWAFNDSLCTLQASISQFSSLSCYLWTLCIAWSIFLAHYKEHDIELIEEMIHWYYGVCYLLPLLISIVPLFTESQYGSILSQEDNWCWISDDTDLWRLLIFIPCIVIFLANCTLFVLVTIQMNKHNDLNAARLRVNMALYILAYLLAQAIPMYHMVRNFYHPDNPIYILYLFQGIFNPMQGFFNGIAYGLNEPAFTQNIRMWCVKHGLLDRTTYEPINSIKPEDYSYDVYASNGSILYETKE